MYISFVSQIAINKLKKKNQLEQKIKFSLENTKGGRIRAFTAMCKLTTSIRRDNVWQTYISMVSSFE